MEYPYDQCIDLYGLYCRLLRVDLPLPQFVPEPFTARQELICCASPNRNTCPHQAPTYVDSQPYAGDDADQYAAPDFYADLYGYAVLACAANPYSQTDQYTQSSVHCDLCNAGGEYDHSPRVCL